jgi:hypothetical protein
MVLSGQMLAASLSSKPNGGPRPAGQRPTSAVLLMSSVFRVDQGGCYERHTGARGGLRTASKWWILRAFLGEHPRLARGSPPSDTGSEQRKR